MAGSVRHKQSNIENVKYWNVHVAAKIGICLLVAHTSNPTSILSLIIYDYRCPLPSRLEVNLCRKLPRLHR